MFEDSPTPPERPDADPLPHPEGGDSRLTRLEEQERLWFSWLTVLHERLGKAKPGDSAAAGPQVLEIAKRRWAEAKDAVRRYQARH